MAVFAEVFDGRHRPLYLLRHSGVQWADRIASQQNLARMSLGVYLCQMRGMRAARPGMRVVDAEYKLRQSIKVAMLYLEDDDAVSAEMFIKKAATLIANCKARAWSHP